MLPFPDKKYKIIYADPAWKYNDKRTSITSDRPSRYGGITYDVMDIDELCKLPVKDIADENCILFIWVTMPLLQDCFKVIEAWHFEYRTCGFVWVKTTSDDEFRSGLGNYTNANAELCLIAVKGNVLERQNKDVKQIIYAPITAHSSKPHEVYARIERLYGDVPRIELFSRHKREGWTAWGNQVPKDTQMLLKNSNNTIFE
jgi:site-specific DNA-methyltransferase (adenine-specific)